MRYADTLSDEHEHKDAAAATSKIGHSKTLPSVSPPDTHTYQQSKYSLFTALAVVSSEVASYFTSVLFLHHRKLGGGYRFKTQPPPTS